MSGLNNHLHRLNLLSMMILIIGFTCPPTIHFKFITKCDKWYDITIVSSLRTYVGLYFMSGGCKLANMEYKAYVMVY